MPKKFHTLIKLSKNKVEATQKELAAIVAEQDKIIAEKTAREQALKRESELATKSPDMGKDFASYLKSAKAKIAKLAENIAYLQTQIDKKREELREAFAEQKRYEIALERKLEEQKKEQEKREQKELDELAGRRKVE